MTRRRKTWIYAAAILFVPALAALGWWFYWPRYQLAVAEKALADNNLVRAEKVLRELMKTDPNKVHVQLLYIQVLRRLGRTSDAERALGRGLERGLSRTNTEALREYALLEAGQDFSLAEGALQRVLQERPNDTEVLKALADGYRRERRWALAERVYTQWLGVQPGRVEVLLDRGLARKEGGQFDKAVEDFREILRDHAEHFQARLLLAHCLMIGTRMREAEPELVTCSQLRPDRPEPRVGLALCALGRDEWDQAQAHLNEALALDPASTKALEAQGELYLRLRNYDAALPVFEKILRIDPQKKTAHLKIAQVLRQKGDLEGAKDHERIYQDMDREKERRGIEARGKH